MLREFGDGLIVLCRGCYDVGFGVCDVFFVFVLELDGEGDK